MKRNLLAILIAIVVTIVLGVPAAFFGGACHCMTAVTVVFPYSTMLMMRTSWDSLGGLLMLQFLIYAVIIANLNGRSRRLIAALVLLVVHVIAAIIALAVVP
jgi:hypothetical protein